MRAKLQKWGNSAAIRLPVKILEEARLGLDQEVDIRVEAGALMIRPMETIPKYSLDDLLAGITDENCPGEVDFGAPVGREGL